MCVRFRGLGLLLLLIVFCFCCGSKRGTADDEPGGPPKPEERFGNDPALVARFAALKACSFDGGRLDYSCPELQALRQQLERGRSEPEKRDKLTTTLRNLLESHRELSRLVAADNLYPDRRNVKVQAAAQAALQRETSVPVKATLLHQLCWEPRQEVLHTARALLDRSDTPEPLRLEAVACLGKTKLAPEGAALLRRLLSKDASPSVRTSLCAVLGEHRVEAAVPEMSAQLGVRDADWRCAMALAALGTEPAYRSLRRGIAGGLERGRLAAQLISALLAFSEKTFFEQSAVVELLVRVAREQRLSWVARQRAIAELSRLGAAAELRSLRARYSEQGELSEEESQVKAELDRALGR